MFHYMHQWNIFVLKNKVKNMNVYYHLPGLFEFYEFYKKFLPLFKNKPEYFYDWCKIGSIYGSPSNCIWSGGRISYEDHDPKKVLYLMKKYNISARLTFSNSLIEEKHLSDIKCNELCRLLNLDLNNGIIIHSDILMEYLKSKYPNLYYVSSTTKVLTDFNDFKKEVENPDFTYVVPAAGMVVKTGGIAIKRLVNRIWASIVWIIYVRRLIQMKAIAFLESWKVLHLLV